MTHKAKLLAAALALLAFTSALDQPAGSKLWDFFVGTPIQSSPALAPDGTVYFGADNGKLYAFDAKGAGKWEFPTGDALVASPAVAPDGTVIIGSTDGLLYAVGADGVEKWRFRANGKIVSSPALGASNSVFFGTMQNTLYAVNGEGIKRWELQLDDAIVSSPAVARDGTVYVTSLSGLLYAVDFWGSVKWKFKASDRVNSSPTLGLDGTIYFGAFDGHVYAVRPNGQKRWTFATGAAVRGSAAIGPDGVVYVGSDDRKLYAFAPDGFKLWTYSTGGWIRSTPAVSADGTIYVGSYDNSLHAVSAVGAKAWEFATDSAISSSPALAADGTIYFGGWSQRFYAVKGSAGLAANAWAKFRGDARQSASQTALMALPLAQSTTQPAFPVEDPKPLTVTSKGAAAEEFARAQAARELAMTAKQAAAARAKAAATPPSQTTDSAAEAKRLAKAAAEADAKTAREAKAAREAAQKAEAEAGRKALADNARVLKDAELARKAQTEEDRRRALSAAELARTAKREADLRATATRKATEDAERLAQAQQDAERKAKDAEAAHRAAEAKAQTEADRKAAMEQARQTKLQHEAEQKTAAEQARQTKLQQEAEQKAAAQAQLAESRRAVEENKRVLKEAEEARKAQMADEARRAAAAAELARLAKKESDQRAATQLAHELAEAKRLQAEAQAAEATRRKSEEEAARQAKAQADAMRVAQAAELKSQQAAAAREQAAARALAEQEARVAAEAERLRVKEQEIARKVMAESEKAAREDAERQAREAARQAAREQDAERRRAEAERQKWEFVPGGFFRRLFSGGASTPKVPSEMAAPVTPKTPPAPAVAPVPTVALPAPPAPATSAVPLPVSVVSPPAPGVPMRIISDSAELLQPAAPAPAPAPSFFTPGQPTVDPLAQQIEELKHRATLPQPQAVQPAAPAYVPPAVPAVPEPAVEVPSQPESGGFWSGVRGFFIRKRPEPQAQSAARPAAQWPPPNIVVRDPKAAAARAQAPAQLPPGLAPAGVTATNFPRVQYAPVTNQGALFLPRAMAAQTNIPGMPQPPSPPREVREMRPTRTVTPGLASELPGAAAPFEMIQGRAKAVLRVYSTGAGQVVPDLNGAELEVGQIYTVEAQPARGAVFLGWTGSVETNSPSVRFIMRTGTMLMANFQFAHNLERELPEVAITAPADGARLTTAAFVLQGQARDNLAVARVEVSVNDGPWEPAQGTDHWAFPGTARPGPNYLRVRAADQAGNLSPAVLRTLHFSVPSPLTVRANGAGTIEPDWHGRQLEVGGTYELRATPAPGHVFTGWGGGVTGSTPTLQFAMRSNLVVEANFAPRLASLARGVFNGLVYPTNSLAPAKCGFFQIEVGADGAFTGFLRQGGGSHPLAGKFDLNGQAAATVTRAGQSAVTVALQLDTTAGERVNGRFTDEGQVVELFGYRQVFDGQAAATPLAGRYTFVIPAATNAAASPAGDAFGEIQVDGAGRVRFAGELPDGTPVRHEAVLGRAGLWPLHVPLAGGRGMVLGWITLTNHTRLDAYGEVIWHKPLAPQDRYYPAGFSTRRHLFGTRYTPTGTAALSGDRRIPGMLSGGNLDKIILGEAGAPVPAGAAAFPTLQQFNWNFRPDTGYVEGTFLHPTTRQETSFRGAFLQKVGWTSGYFLGQNHSGVVHLQLPQ